MNQKTTPIAILCGVIAATLFLAQTTLGGIGVVVSSFTAFPLFVSVLGFGTVAGIISGAVAALIIAVFFGFLGAVVVLLFTLGPALWIGHMAGLSRDDNGVQEWYPISDILFRLAGICAVITIVLGMVMGFTLEAAQVMMSEIMTRMVEMQSQTGAGAPVLTAKQISERAALMTMLLPLIFPVSLFFLLVLNVVWAERFVRQRGWILRPKDHLPSSVNLPVIAAPIFIAAMIVALAPGMVGVMGKVVAGAFGAAYIVVGLATLHSVSENWSARWVLLLITYFSLLISIIVAPILAMIGIAETIFQIRARFSSGSSPSDT